MYSVKFTKIDQTFRNTYLKWPKRSRIKLFVPSNLLKQENVCLIPRESEHPSIEIGEMNNDSWMWQEVTKMKNMKKWLPF